MRQNWHLKQDAPQVHLSQIGIPRDHAAMPNSHATSAQQSITKIGLAYHRRGERPFGIKLADRQHHMFLLGQTGTGKSTLIEQLALQDAMSGHGFCLIDPHGDMAAAVSERLTCDHIYWDVGEPDSIYGYNPLIRVPSSFRPLVASAFIETLRKQWADSWGARMEHLLRYSILALLDQPSTDLRDILKLYLDREFRRIAVRRIKNEQVRSFWTEEFPKMNFLTTVDGLPPIANKLGVFLANPVVRKAVCEPEHPLRFRRLMDDGQIVIVNLAKGRVGADIANVLGGLLVSTIMHAAFTRHDTPQSERRPFFLTVDEFSVFTTGAFADMLSEARKYALSLCLSAQHLSQAETSVLDAIWGNVGSLLTFRVGANDAPVIAKQMGDLDPAQFLRLANYHGFGQLMVDKRKTRGFSFRTITEGDLYQANQHFNHA